MPADPVTVAIPVRDGGPLLEETLAAVQAQELDRPVELLVADSGSQDGSRELALARGAHLIDVEPGEFSHGGTRNLLAERAAGAHVAFLTQDAVPADELWLSRLLAGFELADDVALVFGPYRPRADASHSVRRELSEWFGSMAPAGRPCIDRAGAGGSGPEIQRRAFFTDANGCMTKAAWRDVPFRAAPYAEDRLLAREMLAAGYAKVYHPDAAVIHSHDYGALELFRRAFDEGRGLREVDGRLAPGGPVRIGLSVQRRVRDDLGFLRDEGRPGRALPLEGARSAIHHSLRAAGDALGSRADRLAPALRRACSLEGRGTFEPFRRGPAG